MSVPNKMAIAYLVDTPAEPAIPKSANSASKKGKYAKFTLEQDRRICEIMFENGSFVGRHDKYQKLADEFKLPLMCVMQHSRQLRMRIQPNWEPISQEAIGKYFERQLQLKNYT